jgi:hypothetical protein
MPPEPASKVEEEIAEIEGEERHADQVDVDRDAQQTEAIIRAMGSRDHT